MLCKFALFSQFGSLPLDVSPGALRKSLDIIWSMKFWTHLFRSDDPFTTIRSSHEGHIWAPEKSASVKDFAPKGCQKIMTVYINEILQ